MKLSGLVYLQIILLSTHQVRVSCSNSTDLLTAFAEKKMDDLVQLVTAIQKGFVQLTMRNCDGIKWLFGINYEQLLAAGKPNLSTMTIDLHTKNKIETFNFSSNLGSEIMSSSLFKKDSPVAIFIPGFLASRNSPIVRTMARRLAETGSYNVLAVDPSTVIGWFYYYSSTVVRFIGEAFGKLLAEFYNAGITKFYAIGHSLGAHMCGFAGKKFYNLTGEKLDRLSALDPAGPCFFDESPALKLNSTDAHFVDVIHSDTGTFGIIDPCGHIDFYPNGGESQPNCLSFMCSHNKSWEFFSESITLSKNFPTVQCSSWYTFRTGACANKSRIYMGYDTPTTANGIYYLKTAAETLYGLGEDGITTPETIDLGTRIEMWWVWFLTAIGILR